MRPRFKTLRMLALMIVAIGGFAAGGPTMAQGGRGGNLSPSPLTPVEESRFESNLAKYTPTSTGNVGIVIKLDDQPLATYSGGIAGLAATNPTVTGKPLDLSSPESQAYLAYINGKIDSLISSLKARAPDAAISYRYDIVFGGIAAQVPAAQVSQLHGLPNIELITQDQLQQVETDRTPQFVGATTAWGQLGGQESAGENVIVGVLDTGIWPEHPSFSDPDPSGKPYTPTGGTYACQFGSATPGDAPFMCNNKLIGGYWFMNTYRTFNVLKPGEFRSARDDDGHGTHTSSTSAGNAGVQASIFGVSRGTISGIAPRAHVIMYKVCGSEGCYSSDSAAAVQQAIIDHVNVINFSISGGSNPYSDVVSLAFLDAYNAGIFVAASAGNSGPTPDTTDHREPWVTTVAASTADRAFKNTLTLAGSGGTTLSLRGTSLTAGYGPAPVVLASDPVCGKMPPGTYNGEIVICARGVSGRAEKGFNVAQAGGGGMILYNQSPAVTDLETDNHFLPTTHLQFSEGQQVLAFLAANPGATATISAGVKDTQQGDVMASFSSRGGPGQSLGVSKPDVTAPGVQILAGASPLHVDVASGPNGQLFQAIAGTSMSSPHVAGAGALLKALHPTWTAAQIKSALMTSASTFKLVKEDGVTPFTPFDAGSGRIDLREAGTPGLLFTETGANYVALKDKLWNANYPSLYVPVMPGAITVSRTAQDVTGHSSSWDLSVSYPKGQLNDFKVTVPDSLRVRANGSKSFEISLDARDVPISEVRFATIYLTNDDHHGQRTVIHFPVTIVRNQAVVSLEKTCAPATIARNASTSCTITAVNHGTADAAVTITDSLPRQLDLVTASVVGASANGRRDRLTYTGTIPGVLPTGVSAAISPDASPAGYFPLSNPVLGSLQVAAGDETITNFTVPAFTLGGKTYTKIGIVSDGYLVLGGGTGADVQYLNQNLPDPALPNNVLAPFWTDLNPGAGGKVWINVLTDGVNTWIVVEFENVPVWSNVNTTNTFQVWIGIGSDTNDVSFTYGAISGGDGGFATVGAENEDGSRGSTIYLDGVGTLPVAGTEVDVVHTPGQTYSHTITYSAKGSRPGNWVNYAQLIAPTIFDGTNIARFAGSVTR